MSKVEDMKEQKMTITYENTPSAFDKVITLIDTSFFKTSEKDTIFV